MRRSADPYSAIWDNLSVLDWIAMMEEVRQTQHDFTEHLIKL